MFTNEMKEIIKMFVSAFITAMTIAGIFHCFTYESKIEEAFENGYEQAILEAVLVSSNEDGYVLSFNGELHSYSFK